jgi:hypothetical protein
MWRKNMSKIDFDFNDLRWIELFNQLQPLVLADNKSQHKFNLAYVSHNYFLVQLDNHNLYVYFYDYKRAIYLIMRKDGHKYSYLVAQPTFDELFESLRTEYKEIFCFYFDLFSSNELNVVKKYE